MFQDDAARSIYEALCGGDEARAVNLLVDSPVAMTFDTYGRTLLILAAAHGSVELAEKLVAGGAPMDHQDQWGLTALAVAALFGQKAVALCLLEAGADPELRTLAGFTAVHWAAAFRRWAVLEALHARGAHVDALYPGGGTVLEAAAAHNDLELARRLLELGADVNLKSEYQDASAVRRLRELDPRFELPLRSPLRAALSMNHAEMARLLLLRGATASLADARVKSRLMEANADDVTRLLRHATGTLIHDAAGTGDRDSMLLLIGRGASLESRDEWGGTPLHTAVRGGQALTLEALLQAGAPVDAADSRGLTPLICAVDRNEPAAMVRLLLAHGASPAGTGSDTPLFHAAEAGYEEVAGILIDAGAPVGLLEAILMGDRDAVECHLASGASVDAANASGMIPLAAAAAQGDIASIRTLLNRGARVDPVGDVRSPLLTAIDREQLEAARLLLEAGANANSVIAHQTPLASAVSRNSVPLVKLLLEFGAKPRGECLGVTLVEEAVSQNGPEIVSMLIEAGADANIGAGLYGTPLMAAVRSGNVECARVLLERGALPDLEDNRGKTPLGIAEAEGPPALVELLRQAGATQSKNSQTASPVPVRRIARLQVPLECLFQYRRLFSAQCPQFPAQLERLLAPALATGVIPQDLLREALTDDPEEVLEALQLLDQLCAFSGDAPSPAA